MLGLTLALALTFGTQTPTPADYVLTLIVSGQEASITESAARSEYETLWRIGGNRTKAEEARFVALHFALGTTPVRPRCITWEQHVAEVTSWWAAPEREYVDCSDPRVRPKD